MLFNMLLFYSIELKTILYFFSYINQTYHILIYVIIIIVLYFVGERYLIVELQIFCQVNQSTKIFK